MKFRNMKTNEHVEITRATGERMINGVRPEPGELIIKHADGSEEIASPHLIGADDPERLYEQLPA